jgi:uncharacterized protein (TIGR02284 family)
MTRSQRSWSTLSAQNLEGRPCERSPRASLDDRQRRRLGGHPAQGGSVSGSVHRAWTNIKSTITGMNEHAVLAECERGEDTAKHAYEAALKQDLPMDVRTIIERQYQGVKENHDRVRNLRNGAAPGTSRT